MNFFIAPSILSYRSFIYKILFLPIFLFTLIYNGYTQKSVREDILLNEGWLTIAAESGKQTITGFEQINFNDQTWKKVEVPHNWDRYEGFRRMKHGNFHGNAWYRKQFTVPHPQKNKQYFLF